MTERADSETNYNDVRVWLQRAQKNAARCFVCGRIAQSAPAEGGNLRTLKLGGVEIDPETQIAHLARCVGKDRPEGKEGS